jgi:hypothetical protein
MNTKITILGQEYSYLICSDADECDEWSWTIFYNETKIRSRKKYFLFGPIITWEEPIELFRTEFDIEDLSYTKEELRVILEKKLKHFLGLQNREEEIRKGDLI